MIIEKNKVDVESFITVFTKKFQNFCTRIPLYVSYDVTPSGVTIYEYKDNAERKEAILQYDFDFTKSVKENIFQIRQKLMENNYPVMMEVGKEEVIYSSEDLNDLISSGKISINDVTEKGGVVYDKKTPWRIEKVIVQRDQLFVRNLSTNEVKRFKLKIPSTLFINRILNEISDMSERFNFFKEKSKYIGDAYDVDADNNVINKEN